mgnify:CR=1 FL=1
MEQNNHHHCCDNKRFHNDADDATGEKSKVGKNARRKKGDFRLKEQFVCPETAQDCPSPPPQALSLVLLKS